MTHCKSLLVFVIGFLAADCLQPAAAADTAEFEIRDEAGNVLVATDQIRSYDLATHTLTLLPQVRGPLCEKLLKGRRLVSGVPFAVVVDGKTVYEGNFTTSFSSRSFSTPVILADLFPLDPNLHEDQLHIQLGYPTAEFLKGQDQRADERIRSALATTGKLASTAPDHTAWVAASLLEMQAIKPGMTRGDLLKVFKEEGGISTRTTRRYAYRDCPYIKVDVKFDPVGSLDDKLTNAPEDKITQISQPFLEWPIHD